MEITWESFWEAFQENFIAIIVVFALIYGFRYYRAKVRIEKEKKGELKHYATLHNVEMEVVKGEISFFYELPVKMEVTFQITDYNNNVIEVLLDSVAQKKGSYPLKYDTTQLKNDTYFYQLLTPHQKVTKKLVVGN
jgi:hypothetical protein